jgi:cytochrome o ubiquinol oxidase subunit 2
MVTYPFIERTVLKPHRIIALLPLVAILSACNAVVLHPSGDVAAQQSDLIFYATELMAIVIVPVVFLTALFAWHYRASNTKARYEPHWHHSTKLEVVIWGVPVIIIIFLGIATWTTAHTLDPYHQVSRIAPGQPVPAGTKTLEVQVVALDWKWLFIYPDYGIATVNDLAAPVNQPIEFRLTSDRVQNALSIPALAGQIYAMPTMETELHAVINEPGDYKGYSSRFSGAGFSKMHFVFHGLSNADFDKWIADAKAAGGTLDSAAFLQLAVPSEAEPIHRYANVDPQLYKTILDQCVGKSPNMCLSTQRANDIKKGNGLCRPNVASN